MDNRTEQSRRYLLLGVFFFLFAVTAPLVTVVAVRTAWPQVFVSQAKLALSAAGARLAGSREVVAVAAALLIVVLALVFTLYRRR